MRKHQVTVILGLQRGDEGKGRLSDNLAASHDIVARYNGGPNAGHTIFVEGRAIALHQVPSGVLHPKVLNVIGNGMFIDPLKLLDEIKALASSGIKLTPSTLAISYAAHLILPHHILMDELREGGSGFQGSTKSGIAYVASEKYERIGVRAELITASPSLLKKAVMDGLKRANQLGKGQPGFKPVAPGPAAKAWVARALKLKPYITDTAELLDKKLKAGATMLAEGAQAAWLDIDGGMYPYVSSSHPTIGGALNGLRISHSYVGSIVGVIKAVPSHVGGGPFLTEITEKSLADKIRGNRQDIDGEFGATTGRARRVGWLDLPAIRTAIRDNGVTELALTKLDTLQKFDGLKSIPVAVAYKYRGQTLKLAPSSAIMLENCQPIYRQKRFWYGDIGQIRSWRQLPDEAKNFIRFLEKELGLPVSMIGVGPDRNQLIIRPGLPPKA